jgi:hypothetical protein
MVILVRELYLSLTKKIYFDLNYGEDLEDKRPAAEKSGVIAGTLKFIKK